MLPWLVACAHPPPPVPVLVGDAGRIEGDRVELAVVGGWLEASDAERSAVLAGADAMLLLGETARGTSRAWASTVPTLGAARVLPIPGDAERRSDRDLQRFHQVFEGYGVEGGGVPASWQSFQVVSRGSRWRVVVLDADAAALGSRFGDELSWLPKVLGGDDPVLVVANAAAGSNAEGYTGSPAMAELLAVLHRHLDPTRLVLVASAAPRVTELVLPHGPWGEGWLASWLGTPDVLLRARDGRSLERALDLELLEAAAKVGQRDVEVLDASVAAWSPAGGAARGWWTWTFEGPVLSLEHHPIDGGVGAIVRWTPDGGWATR